MTYIYCNIISKARILNPSPIIYSKIGLYMQFQVCVACNISYSAIIKLETLRADADWIFDKLNLTQYKEDWESLAAINKAEGSGTGDNRVHGGPGGKGGLSSEKLSSKYFSQIGKKNIRRLYEKYSVDFEMFGYDGQVQSYIDMGY